MLRGSATGKATIKLWEERKEEKSITRVWEGPGGWLLIQQTQSVKKEKKKLKRRRKEWRHSALKKRSNEGERKETAKEVKKKPEGGKNTIGRCFLPLVAVEGVGSCRQSLALVKAHSWRRQTGTQVNEGHVGLGGKFTRVWVFCGQEVMGVSLVGGTGY